MHPTYDLHTRQRQGVATVVAANLPAGAPPAYNTHMRPQVQVDNDIEEQVEFEATPINIKLNVSLQIEGTANNVVLPQQLSSAHPGFKIQEAQIERYLSQTISILKKNRLLETLDDNGITRDRELNINVEAGICVKGMKNTVYQGLGKAGKGSGPATTFGATTGRMGTDADSKMADLSAEALGQKRRSCSVSDSMEQNPGCLSTMLTSQLGTS